MDQCEWREFEKESKPKQTSQPCALRAVASTTTSCPRNQSPKSVCIPTKWLGTDRLEASRPPEEATNRSHKPELGNATARIKLHTIPDAEMLGVKRYIFEEAELLSSEGLPAGMCSTGMLEKKQEQLEVVVRPRGSSAPMASVGAL
ncbi:hypothetical protein ZHAS_00004141 [Anopheles sinensis]|uniref:Uncharacterized protein n=1 Tax=Anopheles sinensis TaxID=74873 RepID=A0A084VG77_ANOSI|nr:hypothetical protein ZHAS_00004141 [Anopheles sinensis]